MGLFTKVFGTYSQRELKSIYPIVDKITALEDEYKQLTDAELQAKTPEFKERLANGETLDDILPEAFAAVREAADRVLGMRPYPVQLVGGIVLHQGRIAEMKTGEGKTLVATLPAYLNALTGEGVHIVTVNDYLARRDSEWMGKVYRYLGLSVGLIVHGLDNDQRRAAYAADITYGTNNELGFDYLRDNMVLYKENLVQREHNFAIVDEVDSILVDEARTPLIISGTGDKSTDLYARADSFAKTLKAFRIKEMNAKEEQDTVDGDYIVDEKARTATLTRSGVQKAESYFKVENLMDADNVTLLHHIDQAIKANGVMRRDVDYVVKDGQVIIVDEFTGRLMLGRRYNEGLHQAIEAKEGVKVERESKTLATITFQNYFRLYSKLSGMTGTAKTEETEFQEIYHLDVIEIPTNKPVIRIDYPDSVYKTEAGKFRAVIAQIEECHKNNQPVLVGTISIEKSEYLSKLLKAKGIKHEVLNAKYHEKEAAIIAQAGKLGAVTIATNMAGRGTDIMLGGNPEFMAVQDLRNEGYSDDMIDVATSYVQDITDEQKAVRDKYREYLKEHEEVTDAEKKEVIALGGLHIIGTERHESRRIDNQLRGRSGRQGDPGSSLFFISLEDDLAKRFGGERLQSIYRAFKVDDDTPLQSKMLSRSIENAQRTIEGKNFGIRKHIIEYDDVMNLQRKIMYEERMKVLRGDDVHQDVLNLIPDFVAEIVRSNADMKQSPVDWDKDRLNKALEDRALPPETNFITDEVLENWDAEYIIDKAVEKVIECYEEKIARYKEQGLDFSDFERFIFLKVVDNKWIDHIDAMDKLKRGISLRGYANEDPVIAYKKEGVEMFDAMTASIQEDVVALLLKSELRKVEEPRREPTADLVENGGSNDGSRGSAPIVRSSTVGRNDPCPCGSGKKFKNCCGRNL